MKIFTNTRISKRLGAIHLSKTEAKILNDKWDQTFELNHEMQKRAENVYNIVNRFKFNSR